MFIVYILFYGYGSGLDVGVEWVGVFVGACADFDIVSGVWFEVGECKVGVGSDVL